MIPSHKTYKIVNVKTGTVLNLSGETQQFVSGGTWNAEDTQKWFVEEKDGGWILRNIGTSLHLGINGDVGDGTPAVTVAKSFHWQIKPDDEDPSTYRLFVPNTHYNLDLTNGCPTSGTPIIVWTKWLPGKNQTWRFEEE